MQRFDCIGHDGYMEPDAEGEYVAYAEARAEIERLNSALTEAAKQISDLATRLGQAEGRLDASELVGIVEGWKARAEKAEDERDANAKWLGELLAVIHRDGGHYQSQHGDEKAVDESHRIWARLITERDEALAQVAAAYEAAARRTESEDVEYPSGTIDMEGEELREILRALTPAHAKAALEAYGREKVREGMKWAAEIIRGCCPECQGTGVRDSGGVHPWGEPISVPCDCADAILGGMETIV